MCKVQRVWWENTFISECFSNKKKNLKYLVDYFIINFDEFIIKNVFNNVSSFSPWNYWTLLTLSSQKLLDLLSWKRSCSHSSLCSIYIILLICHSSTRPRCSLYCSLGSALLLFITRVIAGLSPCQDVWQGSIWLTVCVLRKGRFGSASFSQD